ncbi:tRNA dihydrouridine synthase [Ascoidea rubescens DSM 1968]|uniref:tRNA-dihydrouridine synthase n=1 Tax=Ascoidea rubescens DSM 1968 TaxID=1344418 RepID=A0A1D2VQH5_9ASCO|nr:dihydrouridine synthase [Ascoidea rubescens DSM 1968]ODV63817.1 dihydrouridine synthase [Ascoidea rubescens DSM 1968]
MTTKVSPSFARISPRNSAHNPINIFKECKKQGRPAFISGPMVRYSKLPFRELVRNYNVDIVYSPMILAREFVRNEIARCSDFTTNDKDRSLVVQVGSNNVVDFLRFIEMIHPYCDAIGLNCGCPVKEQVRSGIGAALMSEPEKVAEMIKAAKDKFGDKVTLETKIRIHKDIQETVRFVKMVEAAGVDWITVHGRTQTTRSSQPANFEAIKIIKESVSVPVVANGDCFSLEDAHRIANDTGVDGVMAVRGILENPAMFSGYKQVPWGAIERFFSIGVSYSLPFRVFQHHLSTMLESQISKQLRLELNNCKTLVELIDWFDAHFMLRRSTEEGYGKGVEVDYLVRPKENECSFNL